MANDGAASGGGGSSIGAPAAGAVAPARMSDLGVGGSSGNSQAMSDLGAGSPMGPGAAAPGERMVPLKMEDITSSGKQPNTEPEAEQQTELQPIEEQQTEEQQPQQDGQLTPELALAAFTEWQETGQVPAQFQDLPIWIPDGKDGFAPIRLGDIHNNVLMYKDYQKKTTEVSQQRKQNEMFLQGRQRWIQDMTSGDPEAGLRAIRGVGAEKTLEQIVIKYIRNMAELEGLPPQLRQQFLDGQKARDENYYLQQNIQLRNQELERIRQEQQAQGDGLDNPQVKFVTDHIKKELPSVFQAYRIEPTPLIEHLLEGMLAQEAKGERDPQTGQWTKAPTIQLGRAPSRELLSRLVVAAKQQADKWTASQGKPLRAPPPTQQLRGSGPAAKPGQKGNIGAPKQARFSDLAIGTRPR